MTLKFRSGTALQRPRFGLNHTGGRRWAVVLSHGLLIPAVLSPMTMVEVPHLVDYSNHLARAHRPATSHENPLLQERYTLEWNLVPNFTIDPFVVPLASFISIFTAGRPGPAAVSRADRGRTVEAGR